MNHKLVMLWLSVWVLCACAPVRSALDGAQSGAPVVVDFLISGDATDERAYRALADAFMAAQPDVQVAVLNIPSFGDFRRRLAADFAAGAPPDLFLINYRRYGPFVAGGALAPVAPYLAQSTALKAAAFYPQALEAFTWQGVLQCLPQNISSPVVYFNKRLFDTGGVPYPADDWTWAEFVATAQALTRDLDGDGARDQFGLGVEPSLVRAAPFIWMNGGEIVDDPAAPTQLTLDSPATRAALAWFIGLQTEHHVTPDAVAEAAESSLSRFVNGRLAMIVESRRATPEFRLINAFEWDVAPLPTGLQPASILHADGYCMSAAGSEQAAAWRFVEFANTRTGQRLLAQSGRTIPSRIDLAADPAFLDPAARPANSRVFVDAIPVLRSLPALATWSEIESAIDVELKQAFYGQISLDAALEAAATRSAEFFPRDAAP